MPQTFCDFYPLANNLHVTFYRHFQKSTENEAIAKIQIFANDFPYLLVSISQRSRTLLFLLYDFYLSRHLPYRWYIFYASKAFSTERIDVHPILLPKSQRKRQNTVSLTSG